MLSTERTKHTPDFIKVVEESYLRSSAYFSGRVPHIDLIIEEVGVTIVEKRIEDAYDMLIDINLSYDDLYYEASHGFFGDTHLDLRAEVIDVLGYLGYFVRTGDGFMNEPVVSVW